jgi:hypothetical protein
LLDVGPFEAHIWGAGATLGLQFPNIARLVPGFRPAALAINAKDDAECCI